MYKVGDKIVYPMHGVGSIDAIEKKTVLGKRNEFYIIEVINTGMKAMIPVKNADEIGIRSIIPKKEVKKVLEVLSKDEDTSVDDWKERYQNNIDKVKSNVIISRKAYLEVEKKKIREKLIKTIKVGQVKKGVISNILDFGAFVDLGGVDGLIHISELSWGHVNHPSEIVQIGDEVEVVVLDVDKEKKRVALGLKQTQIDPWMELTKK